MGRPVELRHGDDVAAAIGQRGDRVIKRCLAGTDGKRGMPAFERGDAPLQHVDRRIADPAVAEALGLQIEQSRAVIGAVEGIGDRLVNGHGNRVRRRIVLEPAVDRDCLFTHDATNSWPWGYSPASITPCEPASFRDAKVKSTRGAASRPSSTRDSAVYLLHKRCL